MEMEDKWITWGFFNFSIKTKAQTKLDKIKIALEKLKEAKVRKVMPKTKKVYY